MAGIFPANPACAKKALDMRYTSFIYTKDSVVPKLQIKGIERHEWGISRVRLHISHRNGADRYDVAKITNKLNSCSTLVILLGHNDDKSIFMDFDVREDLKIDKDEELDFSVQKVSWPGKLQWYLQTKDPMIHIPAYLAVISLALSITGLIVGLSA
ncbi:hypothetical protein [Thalassospira lucentensis]|uniref:hypothetical protein n=1 Tax=Thalassospira lucentensis TaxID=168935 RepID=UPI0023F0504A|nr:hypothetical protein [Thalassospira lucentensis]